MNRINELFVRKKKNILSVYFTAGYPDLHDTLPVIQALERHGVDLIEIGMPFSDPLADGPVIQRSSEKALKNGMSLSCLFEQLQDVRESVSIPLILMGYINPVVHYGIENFCRQAAAIGIDGVILPDLPPDVYLNEYEPIFSRHGIHNIFLSTPQTPEDRLQKLVEYSHAFLYMVSSASTTGAKTKITHAQSGYFERIQNLNLPVPKLIGFGISNRETFLRACHFAEGAIIGSAFVKALDEEGRIEERIERFVRAILED